MSKKKTLNYYGRDVKHVVRGFHSISPNNLHPGSKPFRKPQGHLPKGWLRGVDPAPEGYAYYPNGMNIRKKGG